MEYDVVGDIHGNAPALEALLARLGYVRSGLGWTAPEGRMLVFVGDFIDRGTQQLAVLKTVRELMESGRALAVMGNHELNAIAWYHRSRPDNAKNRKQHQAFLDQIGEGTRAHEQAVEWFFTLPLWLDLPEIRVVHACWDPASLATARAQLGGNRLRLDQLERATVRPGDGVAQGALQADGGGLYAAIETLLKGIEIDLPEPHSFLDKDGHPRRQVRVKWWLAQPATYREASMTPLDPAEAAFEQTIPQGTLPSYVDAKPVFLGHYWLQGTPAPLAPQIACVDYSAGKGGPLVAGRWRGEPELTRAGFVSSRQNGALA